MPSDPSTAEGAPLLERTPSFSAGSTTSKSSSYAEDEEAIAISASRGAVIFTSMAILIFLQAANVSILTTTQSSIARDLDAFEQTTWLTSSYLISASSIAPLMGRLSQMFSPRLCMFVATLVGCVGTIITSTAVSFEMFIFGRIITGIGAGGIFTVTTIIVVQMASHKRRGLHIGLANSGMTVGVSLGAVIAGALEPKIGWKILFGLQAPIALLGGFGILLGIPADHISSPRKSAGRSLRQRLSGVDYRGAILLALIVVLFLFGLSGPRILAAPIIVSVLLLPLFVFNELYTATDPIIPVTVLKSRGALLTCLATVVFMMARWTILFYTPAYALAVRGWSPAVAGSILIPTNAGFAIGGILAGLVHIRGPGSFYWHSLISMALFPITLLVIAFLSTPESSWAAYTVSVFINGLLTGASLNYTLIHLLHLTPPSAHPVALSLLATFRGFAGSFGSAIGGGIFERVLRKSLVDGFKDSRSKHPGNLIRKLMGSPALVRELQGEEKEIAVQAYENAIKALFLAAMGIGLISVVLQAGTGWKEPADKLADQPTERLEDEISGEAALVGGS